ncbi:MAG: hypothetical protein R3E95_12220 [Thiolinea sp.]
MPLKIGSSAQETELARQISQALQAEVRRHPHILLMTEQDLRRPINYLIYSRLARRAARAGRRS